MLSCKRNRMLNFVKPRSFDADDAAITVNTAAAGHEPLGAITTNRKEIGKFIASPHGYEVGWSGVKFLQAGSFGAAGMWEKKDEQGNIIDVSDPAS